MRIEQSLKLRDAARTRIADIFSIARLCGSSSADINAACQQAMPAKAPQWVRAYLDGYRAALTAELYRTELAFGGFYNGVWRSCHSGRSDYYGAAGIDPIDWMHGAERLGHYWVKTDSLKPFYADPPKESADAK